MKTSVIVPTYNRPKALKLCLMSLAQQSVLPSEVLIADDGSGPETRDVIQEMQASLKPFFPIAHIWQEDIGFRKPKILNESVRHATGEYLIFIDGDCMAHKYFVQAHLERSDPSAILGGKRVDIGKKLTENLLETGTIVNRCAPRLLLDALMGGSSRVEESILIKNRFLRRLMHRDRIADNGIFGCNFSLYKSLFMDINGCDEDFRDGSFEDTDLGIRVLNQGKRLGSVRGLAIVFHLWHKVTWSYESEIFRFNQQIAQRRIQNKEKVCKNGIRKID